MRQQQAKGEVELWDWGEVAKQVEIIYTA